MLILSKSRSWTALALLWLPWLGSAFVIHSRFKPFTTTTPRRRSANANERPNLLEEQLSQYGYSLRLPGDDSSTARFMANDGGSSGSGPKKSRKRKRKKTNKEESSSTTPTAEVKATPPKKEVKATPPEEVKATPTKEVKATDIKENKPEEKAPSPPPAKKAEVPTVELKAREDKPVEIKVTDVVEAVGSSSGSSRLSSSSTSTTSNQSTSVTTTSKAGMDMISSSSSNTTPSTSSSSMNDSLEQLLEDARRMQAEEKGASTASEDDESSSNVKATIRNTLSTIVTADFFLVCAFLVWFLVGIFCSTVLKDDTIQIAFNSNFEKLVQPALGILMIAAIAGNFFKDEEEEQGSM